MWLPQVFSYIGLLEAIAHMIHHNPDYAENRGKGTARTKAIGSYRNSPAFARLNAVTGGQLDDPNNSTYEIGYDDAAIFNVAQHSTGFITLRYFPA
jgi:hypothetical protein